MPFAADSIWVNVSTSGLADFTMTTALAAYQNFVDAGVPNGATVHYTARTATEFENGEGVYNSGTGVVTRVTIFESSNAGAKVSFGSSPTLAISPLAEDAIFPPATSTDEALVRWDGTGGDAVQNSSVFLDDSGNLTLGNVGLHLLDTNATHDLIIKPGSDLTADRTWTLVTGDANRTLTMTNDTTLGGGTHSGTNTGDQTITLTGNVTGSGTGSFATTIAADVVANTMLANMAQSTIKGRAAGAGTGDPTDLTAAQTCTVIEGSFGAAITSGTGVSTGSASIELGGSRTGDGSSFIDLHAVSGTDFELRILRNAGANGTALISHTGTGAFDIGTAGAAALNLQTSGSTKFSIGATTGMSATVGSGSFGINCAGGGSVYISACNGGAFEGLLLETNFSGTVGEAWLGLHRADNHGSGAIIGELDFYGVTSTPTTYFRYGRFLGFAFDNTAGSEDFELRLNAIRAGAMTDLFAIRPSTTARDTWLMIYDVDNGTMERVSVGAADSGSAGFKYLRIPN